MKGKGNIEINKAKVWNFFFKTDKKCFHTKEDNHDYTFNHMIETDGVNCYVLLIRKDLFGKRHISSSNNVEYKEKYIDELDDCSLLQEKKIVAIDPNMSVFFIVLILILKIKINFVTLKTLVVKKLVPTNIEILLKIRRDNIRLKVRLLRNGNPN